MDFMVCDNTGKPTWISKLILIAVEANNNDFGFVSGHVHILKGEAKVEGEKISIVLETELTDGHPLPGKPKMTKVGQLLTHVTRSIP